MTKKQKQLFLAMCEGEKEYSDKTYLPEFKNRIFFTYEDLELFAARHSMSYNLPAIERACDCRLEDSTDQQIEVIFNKA